MPRPAHPADDRSGPPHGDGSVAFEGRAMASPLRLITVEAGDPDGAWAATCAEFRDAEAAMTRFRADSELSRLNARAGDEEPVPVDRRLRRAVIACDRAARVTHGRFDARIVVDLERLGDDGVPQRAPRARGSRGTGARLVRALQRPGCLTIDDPIDLGGIGKGLALRWARDLLDRQPMAGYLLEAGGDLVARGRAPDGGPWRIAIEDPSGGPDALAVLGVRDLAVATSSVRRRQWAVAGRAVHHLIDPATGEPADGRLRAVTVAGSDPAWAEIWSKALFVGGYRDIGPVARSHGLAAWWVTDDGALEMTPAARPLTQWVAAEA
jgi:thiamine biosynthesis lipoprotein